MGSLDASDLTAALVVGRFNDLVTKLLLEGALDAFRRHGGAKTEVSNAKLAALSLLQMTAIHS